MLKEKTMLDFYSQGLLVSRDKIPQEGEDSYCGLVNDKICMIGVFDGLGGSGSEKYEQYGNHSGAYIASRVVSRTMYQWFEKISQDKEALSRAGFAEDMKQEIDRELAAYGKNLHRNSMVRNRMAKTFPTTLAMSVLRYDAEKKQLYANILWCGDSRCYYLDDQGMHQLSYESPEEDALEELYRDIAMNEAISISHPYSINEKRLVNLTKGIMVTSTDGCFAYLPSPMHFEFLILDTLMYSENVDQWQEQIDSTLKDVSGDDYTMNCAIFGFEDFASLQDYYRERHDWLLDRYMEGFEEADLEERQKMWEEYRPAYKQFMR